MDYKKNKNDAAKEIISYLCSMKLQTIVDIQKSSWLIGHESRVMLLGSCFADEVGNRFVRGGFDVMVNPFGTLYNPASIAAMLLRCISLKECAEVFEDKDGVWHSWMHHSRFSAHSKEELLGNINSATEAASNFLHNADVLIVTFGTSIIYRLKESGMLVANCHKQADSCFVRERLSSYDIVDQWQMVIQLLKSINPKLRIIFTVSPIRHKRDGYHVNNISKGILLQAVDALTAQGGEGVAYFPSYEIMLDELRDYRFYAEDMIHPSALATDYIWERFQDTYFSSITRDAVLKCNKEFARNQHRQIVKD